MVLINEREENADYTKIPKMIEEEFFLYEELSTPSWEGSLVG